MTATKDITEQATRIGRIEMRVEPAERTPESEERWSGRVDALTAWLLSQWERERALKEAC